MSVAITIKVLCVKLNISVAELARRSGTTPQAFNQKLKREAFTPAELDRIAQSVGCRYESAFILPDGERLADQYPDTIKKGEVVMQKKRVLTDADIERRCRYRLSLHGLKMHKVKGDYGSAYYLYEDGDDDSEPEDDFRYMTLDQVYDYCGELAEKDAERRYDERTL